MSALMIGLSPARRRMEAIGLAYQRRCEAEARARHDAAEALRLARQIDSVTHGLPTMPATYRRRLVPMLRALDLAWTDLIGRGRAIVVTRKRQAVMYGLAGHGLSVSAISRLLQRHHTTVLYGIRAHAARLLPARPRAIDEVPA